MTEGGCCRGQRSRPAAPAAMVPKPVAGTLVVGHLQ